MPALESDQCRRLVEAIRHAHAGGQGLAISGSGSKSFLMPAQQDSSVSILSVAEHSGILDYQPQVELGDGLLRFLNWADQHYTGILE